MPPRLWNLKDLLRKERNIIIIRIVNYCKTDLPYDNTNVPVQKSLFDVFLVAIVTFKFKGPWSSYSRV